MDMVKKQKPADASTFARGAVDTSGKYISIKKAAGVVGVTPESIRLWIRRGLLPAKKFKVVQMHSMVLKSALDSVRTVKCLHCGKSFQAKRPQKARFCTAKHRDLWNYQNRRAELQKLRKAAGNDKRKA